jgi:hypothetical protein
MRDTLLALEEHLTSAFVVLKRLLTAMRERPTMERTLRTGENCE